MSVNLLTRAKHRLSSGVLSSHSQGDNVPLIQIDKTLQLHDWLNQDKQRAHSRQYSMCYLLHIFLVALHLVLAIAARYHPEHHIVVSSAGESFTVKLSGGLQAFYTLYATLLVFVTQRLMLSTLFCGPTKLTRIHDICGAWCGLGAALRALWQQTKVNSSVFSIGLVVAYFLCAAVLHVASSTIMEFQPFNATVILMVSSVATWPDPIDGFTSLDRYDGVVSLSPYIQDLYGNTTQGLANNTLYDVPVSPFVNATVDATMLNAHCGLLTNVSIERDDVQWNIIVSMPGLDPFSITPRYLPLPNEVWFTTSTRTTQPFVTYLVSTAIEHDESVSGTSHVYINGTFSSPDGVAQNITTQVYIVACTFDTTTRAVALETPETQLATSDHLANATWSAFSPGGDTNLSLAVDRYKQIVSAMVDGTSNNLPTTYYCQPYMSEPYWKNLTNFDAYMISALGLDLSWCNRTSFQPNSTPPYLLTADQVEKVTSQIAAGFVWLAGELGEAGGGFDRQTKEAQIMEYALKWRLNINVLPVISSLCASISLCVLVICMLWGRGNQQGVIPAAGMLEIMWFGSRSSTLRDQLGDIRSPSVDGLRASSTFETVLWRRSAYVLAGQENFDLYAAFPLLSHFAGSNHGEAFTHECPEHLPPSRLARSSYRAKGTSDSHWWCNALHTFLLSVHVILLSLLVNHPEHSIIIPLESLQTTTGLSALLQVIYTLYSALLVFVLQRLSFMKMVSERRKLTTVHDVSGAWNGIGAAILILLQQRKVPSSPWQVIAVVTYLASMLVLHIVSSSIMQWQAFDNNLLVSVSSGLALPDSSLNISQLEWSEISPIACSAGQDSNMPTYGLSNSTVYDIPQALENVGASEAVVNATTFSTQCGLVPNLTFLSDQLKYPSPDSIEEYRIGFSLNGTTGNNSFLVPPTWKDLLHRVDGQCTDCPHALFYMITTAVDLDESVHDPVVLDLNWTYVSSSGGLQTSKTRAYIAACSVSTHSVPARLNLEEKKLDPILDQTALSALASWSVWSPAAATNINIGMTTALSKYYTYSTSSSSTNGSFTYSTTMDAYMMSLLGLNWTAAQYTAGSQPSTDPTVTLTPAQLENAISQTAARFMWVAGQLGDSNGGFNRTVGKSQAIQHVLQWRLNINTIPVIFASAASFVALVTSIYILGGKTDQERPSSVSGTSVLESLWLEANSEVLHSRLQAVEEPCSDRLRKVGMVDIRLGDIKAGCSCQCQAYDPEQVSVSEGLTDDLISRMADE